MKRWIIYPVCAGLLAVTAFTARQTWSGGSSGADIQAPAKAVITLLHAQPFLLEESYTGWYRAEQPQIDAGWLLVLDVPAELAEMHQGLDRVLYVGEQTAERWNTGQPTGHVVVSVPAERGSDGLPAPLSNQTRIWFGTPELPERVDAPRIVAEIALAEEAAVPSLMTAELATARERGGELLQGADHHDLGYAVADLVERYSPEESEYIETLRIRPNE